MAQVCLLALAPKPKERPMAKATHSNDAVPLALDDVGVVGVLRITDAPFGKVREANPNVLHPSTQLECFTLSNSPGSSPVALFELALQGNYRRSPGRLLRVRSSRRCR